MLWDLVDSCIEYAAKSEEVGGEAQPDLLDELDQAASQISAVPGTNVSISFQRYKSGKLISDPHWTHTRFSWTTPTPFLHLAAVCGLSRYVDIKLSKDYSQLNSRDTNTTPLLYSATCCGSFICSEGRTFCSRDIPQVEMIRTLLENGANRNQLYRGVTPWENLLQAARRAGGNRALSQTWVEIIDLFMKYGAYAPVDRASLNCAIFPANNANSVQNHSKMPMQESPLKLSGAKAFEDAPSDAPASGTRSWGSKRKRGSKVKRWHGKIIHSPNKSPPKEQAEEYPRLQPANEFELGDSGNLSDIAEWGSAEEQDAEARHGKERQRSDVDGLDIDVSDWIGYEI